MSSSNAASRAFCADPVVQEILRYLEKEDLVKLFGLNQTMSLLAIKPVYQSTTERAMAHLEKMSSSSVSILSNSRFNSSTDLDHFNRIDLQNVVKASIISSCNN
jgi:hypothetical protein